jgi:hypothetical protein
LSGYFHLFRWKADCQKETRHWRPPFATLILTKGPENGQNYSAENLP